jgi:hypothetical protein
MPPRVDPTSTSGATSVSNLDAFNQKYKKWQQGSSTANSVIVSGSSGSCNAPTYYGDDKRIQDYAVCEDSKCTPMTNQQWLGTYGNCKDSFSSVPPTNDHADPVLSTADQNAWKNHYDPCFNMVTNNTPGFSYFNLGGLSDFSNTYDPLTNTRSGTVTWGGAGDFENTTGVWDPSDDRARPGTVHGKRVAYPFGKGGSRTWVDSTITDSAWGAGGDYDCDSKLSREFTCDLDGHTETSTPGCGNAKDGVEDSSVKFCARAETDYLNTNIAKCCLGEGTTANGPEVDSKGNQTSVAFENCPSDYCVTRKVVGTGDSATCESPVTVKDAANSDEHICYQMSNKCNDFFTHKCDENVFDDSTDDPMKQHCKDWANIQPESFQTIAQRICNIDPDSKFSGNDPIIQTDVDHVKTVLDTTLCREYIMKNIGVEGGKLGNLCEKRMRKKADDSWETIPQGEGGPIDTHDYLKDVCGCYYPSEYYTWWRGDQDNQVGVCKDSSGSIATDARTNDACTAKGAGHTWETDIGQTNLIASIDRAMQSRPECYFQPCTRSLLYDVDSSPCQMNLQICYQHLIEQNTIVSHDGTITSHPSESDDPVQSCNQANLLQSPPPGSDGDDSGSEGGFLGGLFGGGDDDSGGDGGDGTSSTTILLVIVVLLIIIGGVVAVIMLNKGDPSPPQQIVQQPSPPKPSPPSKPSPPKPSP